MATATPRFDEIEKPIDADEGPGAELLDFVIARIVERGLVADGTA